MFNSLICCSKPLIMCKPYRYTWNKYKREETKTTKKKKLPQVILIFSDAQMKNKKENGTTEYKINQIMSLWVIKRKVKSSSGFSLLLLNLIILSIFVFVFNFKYSHCQCGKCLYVCESVLHSLYFHLCWHTPSEFLRFYPHFFHTDNSQTFTHSRKKQWKLLFYCY